MNEILARKNVAKAGRTLLEKGLVARTWGNVSERLDDEYFCISPSGLSYTKTTENDIVKVKISDLSYDESGRKPSSEKGIYAASYELFPDAGFVIHTHQTYASAVGLGPLDELEMSEEERECLGGVAKAAYGLPGTKKLREQVKAAMQTGAHCIMMVNHGVLVMGRDMQDAIEKAELLEAVCERCVKKALGVDGCDSKVTDFDPVKLFAAKGKPLYAQLDDMAQMIGRKIASVSDREELINAELEKCEAVLVQGRGSEIKPSNPDDEEAMKLLISKACVCALYTDKIGAENRIGLLDSKLQRFVYLKKYSKKKEK